MPKKLSKKMQNSCFPRTSKNKKLCFSKKKQFLLRIKMKDLQITLLLTYSILKLHQYKILFYLSKF